MCDPMDAQVFLIEFQDHLAPKLDTYEQAIYLYLVRHSRLIGNSEITVGFKSERRRIAFGIGEKGKPMSEGSAYSKLAMLAEKGCVEILRTTHKGKCLVVRLPNEIPGVVTLEDPAVEEDIEEADFYSVSENRFRILKRENYRCFYTHIKLDKDNFVIDHVISRALGGNSYRNCVAASREANNRKGALPADDFVRSLFRAGLLSELKLEDRLRHLDMLKAGELKPPPA